MPITQRGFSPALILAHRCNAKLMLKQLLSKRSLISHDVVADEMIKASISLQDLRRKIYLKVKTDSAGTGGVRLG